MYRKDKGSLLFRTNLHEKKCVFVDKSPKLLITIPKNPYLLMVLGGYVDNFSGKWGFQNIKIHGFQIYRGIPGSSFQRKRTMSLSP
jgi:hypothetical protein